MTPRSPSEVRSKLDFWQAFSGALLAIFVACHLVLEGSVVISPKLTDFIGVIMEDFYIAQFIAPVIVLLVIFHFWIAARKMPFRAGEMQVFVAHSKSLKDFDTWLWLVQVFTAIIILVGVFYHIYTAMSNLPLTVEKSAWRLHHGWLMFYVVFLPAVILHTGIGVYRLGVKYGLVNKAHRIVWRNAMWIIMICYCILGTCALTRVWFFYTPSMVYGS